MLIFQHKLSNISNLNKYENTIIYYNNLSGSLFVNDNELRGLNILGASIIDGTHIILNKEDKQIIFDFNKNIVKYEKNNSFAFCKNIGNNLFVVSKDYEFDSDYQIINHWEIFDYVNNINIKSYSFGENCSNPVYIDVKNDIIIFQKDINVLCLKENISTPLWEFKLNGLGKWYNKFENFWVEGKIHHSIGVLDGVLWLDIEGHHAIGLDVNTGELLHNLQIPDKIIGNPTKESHQKLPVTFGLFLDEISKKIFGFAYDTYIEIDLSEKKPFMSFYIFEDYCKNNNVHHAYQEYRCCFDEKYFYFADPMSGKIACFNRIEKVFEEIYTFPDNSTSGFLMDIQVNHSNLYVLDSGKTLHIFEKGI